ncbi:HAMP domain-containing sensor histidine kinase [Pseudanabaena sp. FACHB-2040]|uniref:sensor histidine kinase n=1 Tax=Pseudanabaena sp. FACHB-2040 TaxID=2692859 RepID=UPI0016852FF5|nr:HAMP domain-containing sensor histidine kinase [Pseudanabaena sp. FACHB-2040]MBD2257320.1 sensor histidine kinase [Pseudanabaena sp. FACHB-2040]
MFQATRRRLALWYTAVTAVLLLLFASGFYLYVRTTLVERVDDTLNHVVEIVQRSLVIEAGEPGGRVLTAVGVIEPSVHVNVEASFRDNAPTGEDDHIDLEWFGPTGDLLWTTLSEPLNIPLHVNPAGETVRVSNEQVLRQVTERVQQNHQVLGYLRVSHPWFEVTKPSRRLILDLALGTSLMVGTVAGIGWLLSGIAIAPVRDSYQQLKQFTADASHELRNPIAVIQTNVQVALADPEPDVATQQSQLQVIERLTRRLGRLVDDLLFLTRQESGLVPLRRESFDLDLLLAEVTEEQQVIAQEQEIKLDYGILAPVAVALSKGAGAEEAEPLDQDKFTLAGDPDQITRLFTNLIGNALQYTPKAGRVEVTLQPARQQGQPWLQVVVKDTGIGITAEALAHVFDRFYRVDPARSRSMNGAAGSGLGLAIAKVIVDNHRGQIRLDSQPGQGTTVTVLLPRLTLIG